MITSLYSVSPHSFKSSIFTEYKKNPRIIHKFRKLLVCIHIICLQYTSTSQLSFLKSLKCLFPPAFKCTDTDLPVKKKKKGINVDNKAKVICSNLYSKTPNSTNLMIALTELGWPRLRTVLQSCVFLAHLFYQDVNKRRVLTLNCAHTGRQTFIHIFHQSSVMRLWTSQFIASKCTFT